MAVKLKKEGILSKQAKMHGGKYISKEVLAKVKKYQAAARLNYTTVKVDKKTAKAAKERGYQVVQGNRIIGPKTPKFRNRLKSGVITGVKPVKGGYMEEVTLPHTIYDMQSLIASDGIDTLKLDNEYFAFKYKGAESYRAFQNTQLMIDYILGYKSVAAALNTQKPEDLQEEFSNFTVFRLHPDDVGRVIPNMKQRRKNASERRAKAIREGKYVVRKNKSNKSWSEKLESVPQWKAEKMKAAKRAAAAKRRASMSEAEKQAERDKRKAYYQRKKK